MPIEVFHKIVYSYHFHPWKRDGGKFTEMPVLGDNEDGIACYGAVHKLVVILVYLNQTEAIMGVYESHVGQHLHIGQHDSCHFGADIPP